MKSYLNLDRTTKALLVVIALGLWYRSSAIFYGLCSCMRRTPILARC